MSAVTAAVEELDQIEKDTRAKLKAKEITKAQAKEIFAEIKVARGHIAEPADVSHAVKDSLGSKSQEEIDADAKAWADALKERRANEARNAQKACAKCPGFCCLAFAMRLTKTEMRAKIREWTQEIATLWERRERGVVIGVHRYGRARVSVQDEARLAVLPEEIRQMRMILDMVIPLKTTRRLQGQQFRGRNCRFYTCKHFLVEERRCGIYETRPQMCRDFLCETAAQGKVPAVETMYAHPSNTPINAGKLKIRWKPLEIPEKPKRKRKWKPSQSASPASSACVLSTSSALSPKETRSPASEKTLC